MAADGDRVVMLRGDACAGSSLRRHRCACCWPGTSVPASAAGNSPPVAVDDPACLPQPPGVFGGSYPIAEDSHDWSYLALGCAPLVNDTDPDGDPLSVDLVGQPAHGEAEVIPGSPSDWLQYRPGTRLQHAGARADWVSDVITYRAFDGQAYSNEANYRLWVAPINDPPTFTPGPGPDRDPGRRRAGLDPVGNGHLARAAQREQPARLVRDHGPIGRQVRRSTGHRFRRGPDLHALERSRSCATVVINAKDDGGVQDLGLGSSASYDKPDDTSDTVTIHIAIYPAPQAPPVAVDDSLTVLEDTPGHVSVIGNDTDINGDNLALTAVGAAGKGRRRSTPLDRGRSTTSPCPTPTGRIRSPTP